MPEFEEVNILRGIDEAAFDEGGGHIGIGEDIETCGFDASVGNGEAVGNLIVNAGGEACAGFRAVEIKRLDTVGGSAESIAVNGDEEVGVEEIGGVDDFV